MIKYLLLAAVIYFLFRDFIEDYIIPIGIGLAVLGAFGYFLYSFTTEKWVAAEGLFGYASVIGQVALILAGAIFLIWAIFSETGNVLLETGFEILKVILILAAMIGALCVAAYAFFNFGGIYGIIAVCILAAFGFFFITNDTFSSSVSGLLVGHRKSSYGEKKICSNCIYYDTNSCPVVRNTGERDTCSMFKKR